MKKIIRKRKKKQMYCGENVFCWFWLKSQVNFSRLTFHFQSLKTFHAIKLFGKVLVNEKGKEAQIKSQNCIKD